jgi:hypothetical protein
MRWHAALTQAARDTLGARWRNTLGALQAARAEHALHAAAVDVRAFGKAAQRIHDLEQLRSVLARELQVSR